MASSAPSKDVCRDLKTNLKRAVRKPMGFFYCAGGEEGDPVLIIDKQVKSVASKIRKSATIKQFGMGTVEFGHGSTPVFVLDTARPPKLERHLQMFFGKCVPDLKKADIYTRKDWIEDSKPVVEEDLPDFDSEEDEDKSGEVEAASKPSEATESLGWRASQTLKYSQKYVKAANKWQKAYHHGSDKAQKSAGARLETQLTRLDKWAVRVLDSAQAFAVDVGGDRIEKSEAKKPIADLKAARTITWDVHVDMTKGHHAEGYPSKTTKKAASAARSKIKKAHIMLKKA